MCDLGDSSRENFRRTQLGSLRWTLETYETAQVKKRKKTQASVLVLIETQLQSILLLIILPFTASGFNAKGSKFTLYFFLLMHQFLSNYGHLNLCFALDCTFHSKHNFLSIKICRGKSVIDTDAPSPLVETTCSFLGYLYLK